MMCQAKRAGYERQHTALDLHDRKCDQNLARLHKAGIQGVRTVSGDACELDEVLTSFDAMLGEPVKFDTVFIDAPCSGTGTMRRHPEIPWRLTEKDVTVDLPKLQLTMLKEAAARVAAGGELIYATCSSSTRRTHRWWTRSLLLPRVPALAWRRFPKHRFCNSPSSIRPRSSFPYARTIEASSKACR